MNPCSAARLLQPEQARAARQTSSAFLELLVVEVLHDCLSHNLLPFWLENISNFCSKKWIKIIK